MKTLQCWALVISIWLVIAASCTGSDISRLSPTQSVTNTVTNVLSNLGATGTPLPSATSIKTATPSNATVIAAIVQTQPLAVNQAAQQNETEIMPGQDSTEHVRLLAGEPKEIRSYQGEILWSYNTTTIPNLRSVLFTRQGIVKEITLRIPNGSTAETQVNEYGLPEFVIFYPRPETQTAGTPVTSAPLAPASGILGYPSKGVLIEFNCTVAFGIACPTVQTCNGVPRTIPVSSKTYIIPTTLNEWLKQQSRPDNAYCVRPWTGFSD